MPSSSKAGVADEQLLIVYYNTFRSFLNVDSAFDESHKRRLQSNRAQQKLLRLSAQQFHELSTDVYDELQRRVGQSGKPDKGVLEGAAGGKDSDDFEDLGYLEPRDDFHPKRNQARKKLSLLSNSRFNDLSFDILYEIERRLKDHPTQSAQDAVRNPVSAFPVSPVSATAPMLSPSQNQPYGAQSGSIATHPIDNYNAHNQDYGSPNTTRHNNTSINTHGSAPSVDHTMANQSWSNQQPMSNYPQNNELSNDDSNNQQSFPRMAPPPYDTNSSYNQSTSTNQTSESAPKHIQPTTKTIMPAKSTLVEESDSESGSESADNARYSGTSNQNNHKHNNPNDSYQGNVDANGYDSFLNDMGSPSQPGPHQINGEESRYDNRDISQQSRSNNTHNNTNYETSGQSDFVSNNAPGSTEMIKQLENEIHILETKNSSLQAKITEQNEHIQSLVTEGTRLDSNVTKLEKRMRESESVKDSLVEENGRLHQLLGDADEAKENLELELSTLRAELEEKKKEAEDMSSKLETSSPELEKTKSDLQLIQSEFTKVKSELEKSKTELEDSRREFGLRTEQYITDLEAKQQQIQQLEHKVQTVQQETRQLQDEHSSLKQEHSDLVNNPPASRSLAPDSKNSDAILLLEETTAGHKSTISQLQDQLRAKDAELHNRQQQSGTREAQLLEKDQQIAELLTQLSQTQSQNKHQSGDIEAAKKKEDQENESAFLLKQAEQEVGHLKLELEELKSKQQNSRSIYNPTSNALGEADHSHSIETHPEFLSLVQEKQHIQNKYTKLREELEQQQIVTEQVRQEACSFLEEMRELAESTGQHNARNSEQMVRQIEELKKEVNEWKMRYAKLKSKMGGAKSSSISSLSGEFPHIKVLSGSGEKVVGSKTEKNLTPDDEKTLGFIEPKYLSAAGCILAVNVVNFQVAVDDFLIKTRTTPPKLIMDQLHGVVTATRAISHDVDKVVKLEKRTGRNTATDDDTAQFGDSSSINSSVSAAHDSNLWRTELSQASSFVSTTATHLITTTRNYSTGGGISPLLLIDAATTDLAYAVVELIKIAKIRPSNDQDGEGEVNRFDTGGNSNLNNSGRNVLTNGIHGPGGNGVGVDGGSFHNDSSKYTMEYKNENGAPVQSQYNHEEVMDSNEDSSRTVPLQSSNSHKPTGSSGFTRSPDMSQRQQETNSNQEFQPQYQSQNQVQEQQQNHYPQKSLESFQSSLGGVSKDINSGPEHLANSHIPTEQPRSTGLDMPQNSSHTQNNSSSSQFATQSGNLPKPVDHDSPSSIQTADSFTNSAKNVNSDNYNASNPQSYSSHSGFSDQQAGDRSLSASSSINSNNTHNTRDPTIAPNTATLNTTTVSSTTAPYKNDTDPSVSVQKASDTKVQANVNTGFANPPDFPPAQQFLRSQFGGAPTQQWATVKENPPLSTHVMYDDSEDSKQTDYLGQSELPEHSEAPRELPKQQEVPKQQQVPIQQEFPVQQEYNRQPESHAQQYSPEPESPEQPAYTPRVETEAEIAEKLAVTELQQYLKSQSVGIINAIQSLLTNIKAGSNYGVVRTDILTLIACIRPVTLATSKSITHPSLTNAHLREMGKYMVDSLVSCCDRMQALHDSSNEKEDSATPDKQLKQRLASIAFDMAKCIKELVKTVEDVLLSMGIVDQDQ